MEDFRFMLAPMEDYTDPAFRTLCHRHGAELTFTEMARVAGLVKANQSTLKRIAIPDDTPTCIQLLGPKKETLSKFISGYSRTGGFSGFNINLGCPSPEMVGIGHGCAMIKRVSAVKSLIDIIKDQGYDVSIKLRLGMNAYEKKNKVYINLIDATDADYYIVHARHGKQTYSDPADLSVYKECIATGKAIIANGDIKTKEQVDMLRDQGAKGVMIGRSAIRDPGIFDKLKNKTAPDIDELRKEYLSLAAKFGTPSGYIRNVLDKMNR